MKIKNKTNKIKNKTKKTKKDNNEVPEVIRWNRQW